ncbi:Leucine-rich repeat-containing N-terminal, plant-type [Dillenia turbinata]|uniref:non-specific serine/threonine protein kinase n=1 Tax=Dillenia turbinata TaxID=194707 RepID=A0AAN8W0U4_9MAGN
MGEIQRHVIFLLLLSVFSSPAMADDAAIMEKLAKSLFPAPTGWTGSNPCKWTGVSCDSSNRIISIGLSSKSLSGSLPSDLNQLKNLKSLSLQRNQLSGPLPSLSDLSNLQSVFLDNNNFSSVPSSFLSGLTSLQTFSISENPGLEPWTIPEGLADSSNLMEFLASRANIVGSIPDLFGKLTSLKSLKLSYNNLTGSLPLSLAGSSIQTIYLNNQQQGLSGRIDVLGSMTELMQVWLHVNKFSGPIPDLSKCTSLFDLQLRDNQLTGVVPSSLTTHPTLANISLGSNILQGPYPAFGRAKVDLGTENNWCNPVPGPCDSQITILLMVVADLGYPMTVAESWKGNDACKGWIFVSCEQGKFVTGLNFGNQNWTGQISPAIANLTSLKNLLLNDNNLTGTIPHSLTTLKDLQLLDVSNNNLSGKIPNFAPNVTVKSEGNPLMNGKASDVNLSGKNSVVVIAVAVVVAALLVGILLFFTYKCYKKKRTSNYGIVQIPNRKNRSKSHKNGKVKPHNEDEDKEEDVHVYSGGNVSISLEVLRQVTDNFSEEYVLGRGGFGVVYRGVLLDGTVVAVKRMESALVDSGLSEFQAEISVLSKVRHRHLVALTGFCMAGNERLLVYEYMPQGTLAQHLFHWSELGIPPLTWKQRVVIALDVARGVEYLHGLAQETFIHRDLKPSNVLLGDDMRAKVSDFGLVKNAEKGKHSMETRLAGTFGYLAPEYATTGKVSTKVDVYAFGVILMELITGSKSLDETRPEEQKHLVTWFRRLQKNEIMNLLDPTLHTDEEMFGSISKVSELARHCTAREPYQRPDMGHAVNVLAPLVDQWRPSHQYEDSFDVGDQMSLSRELERWQEEDSTITATSLRPSEFPDSISSRGLQ